MKRAKFPGASNVGSGARGRRERLHGSAQQLPRAAAENDVFRLDAVNFCERLREIVVFPDRIPIGVPEVARNGIQRATSGPVGVLIAVQTDHAGLGCDEPLAVGLRRRGLLECEQIFVSAPRDERGGDQTSGSGTERDTERGNERAARKRHVGLQMKARR
jgi:hypothetical protein